MSAWLKLTESEHNRAWSQLENSFGIVPPGKCSNLSLSVTYDISLVYANGGASRSDLESDLCVKIRRALQACVSKGDKIFALDWHHTSYLFDPYARFDFRDECEWLVPVLPDGDFYIFLAPDFKFCLLGHPWEQTISIFGENFISAVKSNKPKLFINNIVKG